MSKKTKYIGMLLFSIISFVSVSMIHNSLAKYRGNSGGESVARVAAFNGDLKKISIDFPLEHIKPGDEKTYDFAVTNFKEGKGICETAQAYQFYIRTNQNIPLTLEIKDSNGKCMQEMKGKNEAIEGKVFPTGVKRQDEYKLHVTWHLNEAEAEYMNEIDYVEIVIEAYQTDTAD